MNLPRFIVRCTRLVPRDEFQVLIVAGIENHQVGGLAGFERSHLVGAAQRVRAVDRRRRDGFLDGHSQPPAGQRNHRLHIERRRMVRIEIGAQRDCRAGVDQCARGSFRAASEGSAGQQRGDDARFGKLADMALGGMLQMIDTRRADAVVASAMAPEGSAPSAWILQPNPSCLRRREIAVEARQQGRVAIPGQVGKAGHPAAAGSWAAGRPPPIRWLATSLL